MLMIVNEAVAKALDTRACIVAQEAALAAAGHPQLTRTLWRAP
jgi:hypothetical protein